MRKQYHFRPGAAGIRAWDVDHLIDKSRGLISELVALTSLREIDEPYWGHLMTPRGVAEHARLINDADLSHPIILSSDGRIMDGMHRALKALLKGDSHISAVRFATDPDPDYVGVDPDDLPYDDAPLTSN